MDGRTSRVAAITIPAAQDILRVLDVYST